MRAAMKKRLSLVVIISVLCFGVFACVLLTKVWNGGTLKYTMYVGLNDKDTYTQIISSEEAEKKISDIALKYVDGFTQFSAKGVYKDEKGMVTHENSLVFEFYAVTGKQMKDIMNEVLKELNQNSILIEKTKVKSVLYEGEKP
jgi:hypothetical protein